MTSRLTSTTRTPKDHHYHYAYGPEAFAPGPYPCVISYPYELLIPLSALLSLTVFLALSLFFAFTALPSPALVLLPPAM